MALNINSLVSDGELLVNYIEKDDMYGNDTLSGTEYSAWITKCVYFLESNYRTNAFTKLFVEKSKNAVGNDDAIYYELLGIIKGVQQIEQK